MLRSLSRARSALLAGLVALACAFGVLVAAQPAGASINVACPGTYAQTDSNPSDIACYLFNMMNSERFHQLVPEVGSDPRLRTGSAYGHSVWMDRYNTLSHQLPGELGLGPRISLAGFNPWHTLGENVAYNTDMTWRGAQYVQNLMFNEAAPNDGHRQNILNRSFTRVGVNVLMDTAHHKMWITFDFGSLY